MSSESQKHKRLQGNKHMSLKYILKNGDTGQEVKRLQGKLPIIIDGKFGPKTEKAVKDYQRQNKLIIDYNYLILVLQDFI